MGNTAWIETQVRPVAETRRDMSVLLALDRELDALAEKLHVTPLSDFHDHSVMVEACNELAREAGLPEGKVEPEWFDSSQGLETIKALRTSLERDFSALKWDPGSSKRHWKVYLLNDLKFCEEVLEEAVARSAAFRLLLVP